MAKFIISTSGKNDTNILDYEKNGSLEKKTTTVYSEN